MNGPLAITYRCTTLLFAALIAVSCSSNSQTQLADNESGNLITDYIEPAKISKVRMSNVHGDFVLSDKQLSKFRQQIAEMTNKGLPSNSLKMGTLSMIVTISGNDYLWTTRTNGDILEVYLDSPQKGNAMYFDVGDVNFNNYLP